MFKIHRLKSPSVANKVAAFLTGGAAFTQTWAPGEKTVVKKAVRTSLRGRRHAYWYIENDQKEIIAAIGVRENALRSGGFEMVDDYLAVHKNYRRQGLGNQLLSAAERYVREKKGRYIYIESCDLDSYRPANQFYLKNGYRVVGTVPDYYVPGEGRVDYFKSFSHPSPTKKPPPSCGLPIN